LKNILKQVIYIFYHEDADLSLITLEHNYKLELYKYGTYSTYGVSKATIIGEFWLHNTAIQGLILANCYLSEMRSEYFDF
jgi:hypothetical protein